MDKQKTEKNRIEMSRRSFLKGSLTAGMLAAESHRDTRIRMASASRFSPIAPKTPMWW